MGGEEGAARRLAAVAREAEQRMRRRVGDRAARADEQRDSLPDGDGGSAESKRTPKQQRFKRRGRNALLGAAGAEAAAVETSPPVRPPRTVAEGLARGRHIPLEGGGRDRAAARSRSRPRRE